MASIENVTARASSSWQVLDLSLALCNALEYLHDVAVPGRIVCHRDLKPDNIGFDAEGTLKLIDFGLGKVRLLTAVLIRKVGAPVCQGHFQMNIETACCSYEPSRHGLLSDGRTGQLLSGLRRVHGVLHVLILMLVAMATGQGVTGGYSTWRGSKTYEVELLSLLLGVVRLRGKVMWGSLGDSELNVLLFSWLSLRARVARSCRLFPRGTRFSYIEAVTARGAD